MKFLLHFSSISILLLLFLVCIFIAYNRYNSYKLNEGFNTDYPQKNYIPSTQDPIPSTPDGTSYMSPDVNGLCPSGFERDMNNVNSLCHTPCTTGDFYNVDNTIYGCVKLNDAYPQNAHGNSFPFAKDNKTNIISPTIDAKCPKNFILDTKSGLCHTKCNEEKIFYGELGCLLLNTEYSQTTYDGSNNPYLISEDTTTKYVSPTSSGICPKGFVLDYPSGLCYTQCESNKKFSATKTSKSIIGCR